MSINKISRVNLNKGSMMLEVLVVVSIVAVSTLASLAVAQKSIALSRQSLHQSQVSFLLEEGAEATRIVRDNSWANISNLNIATDYYLNFSSGTWNLSTTPSTVDIFTRKVVFSSVYRDGNSDIAPSGTLDTGARLVTVTVSWSEGGQVVSRNLQVYLMNIFS